MKKTTVTQTILEADEGKYLTNGNTYGRMVILPEGSDLSPWHEITLAEYEEMSAAKQAEVQDVNY